MPKYFHQEAEKQGLIPVSQPRVTDLHLHDGEPLRFRASFEVLPDIEVSGYQELRAEKQDTTVTDQDVEDSLNHLREQHATYSPVEDRELTDGDFAQVALKGVPEDPEGKPVNMDDVMVEIGGTNTVRDFSDNLRGAKPGDERTFKVSYPEDFSDQRLAGKSITYSISVKSIKKKSLPELNDQFAGELGEFKSLEEVRQKIREGMEHEKQHLVEHAAKEKLIDELVRRHEFEVPEALVDRQIDIRLERGLRALAAQGMKAEDMKRMDFGRLRAGQRDAATREVKASLLLDKIAEAEHIEVSDQEIDHEVQQLAEQTKQPVQALREKLGREGAIERIRNRLRNDKALDFLYRRPA